MGDAKKGDQRQLKNKETGIIKVTAVMQGLFTINPFFFFLLLNQNKIAS